MSFFQTSCFVTALTSFLFGFFILFNNRKIKINYLWSFTLLAIGIWSLGFFGVVFSKNYFFAWLSQYFVDIGGILIPILFLNFVIAFLSLIGKYKKISVFSYIVGIILLVLSFTPLFKKGMVSYDEFHYWVNPGPLYAIFPIFFILFSVFSSILLLRSYKVSQNRTFKFQILYIFLAEIFGVGGGITNFFPQIFNVYPFGNYLVILYLFFISYAISKYHLFDIRVIATELLSLMICVILLIKVLLSNTVQDGLINGSIFVGVTLFSLLLVRSVIHEVEQKKKIEAMADDIKRAYEVEKQAKEELEHLDEAKSQFIMATQHHLRTPLTALKGYLSMVIEGDFGKVSPTIKEKLSFCFISTNRLIKLVNEFLDVSKFQLGRNVFDLKEASLDVILQEAFDEVKPEAEKKKIYLRLEKPAEITEKIMADPIKLGEAFYNLIDNAVKYTEKGGVTVNLQKMSNQILRITIVDTGIGMTPEEVKNVFGRQFERGKEAKKVYALGRGIGLYIAANIIKAHNGKVWAESPGPSKGSMFYVELPIKK